MLANSVVMVTKVKRLSFFQSTHHKMETDFCLFSSTVTHSLAPRVLLIFVSYSDVTAAGCHHLAVSSPSVSVSTHCDL